jgi:hypothetical protein
MSKCLPGYPGKRTFSEALGMSQRCQKLMKANTCANESTKRDVTTVTRLSNIEMMS